MFCMRLALELGMTVRELRSRMSSDELTDWFAYFSIQAESPGKSTPMALPDPQAQTALIKQKLFKGK